MMTLREKKDLLRKIYRDMDELAPYKDLYYKLFHEADELAKTITSAERIRRIDRLSKKTQYRECSYPSIGCGGEDGSAVFEDRDTADALINALNDKTNYYFCYMLEWSGPGSYKIVPTYGYDHNGETVYTAVFMRDNNA